MPRGRSSRLRAREAYHEAQDANETAVSPTTSGSLVKAWPLPTRCPMRESRRGFKAMQEQDGKKQFNISERLEDLRREHEALRWEGTSRK